MHPDLVGKPVSPEQHERKDLVGNGKQAGRECLSRRRGAKRNKVYMARMLVPADTPAQFRAAEAVSVPVPTSLEATVESSAADSGPGAGGLSLSLSLSLSVPPSLPPSLPRFLLSCSARACVCVLLCVDTRGTTPRDLHDRRRGANAAWCRVSRRLRRCCGEARGRGGQASSRPWPLRVRGRAYPTRTTDRDRTVLALPSRAVRGAAACSNAAGALRLCRARHARPFVGPRDRLFVQSLRITERGLSSCPAQHPSRLV